MYPVKYGIKKTLMMMNIYTFAIILAVNLLVFIGFADWLFFVSANFLNGYFALKLFKLNYSNKKLKNFNYGNDKNLWNDFFTNTRVVSSPQKYSIRNLYDSDVFIIVYRNNKVVLEKIISNQTYDNHLIINVIHGLGNKIEVFSCKSSKLLLATITIPINPKLSK